MKNFEDASVVKTLFLTSIPENKYNSISDIIIFLMVVVYAFPEQPQKLFCQT